MNLSVINIKFSTNVIMPKKDSLNSILERFLKDSSGIYRTGNTGYWSNLSKDENTTLRNSISSLGPNKAVKELIPHLYDMIYDPKREAALDLFTYKPNATCLDFGCMWGVLSVGASKRFKNVISLDQTYESLYFLNHRCKEEKIENISCIQCDLKKIDFENIADYAVVNGVLEWIPIDESVEVDKFHQNSEAPGKTINLRPKDMQVNFLKVVYKSLKKDGEIVLAIENRHSYQYYMGMKDPHVNLFFTTFMPRFISNFISLVFRKRPYRNFIYSFNDIRKLVGLAGFKEVQLYAAFPNYHFPEMILGYSKAGFENYERYPNKLRITYKQKITYFVEIILMKYFRARFFSPAIIVKARK